MFLGGYQNRIETDRMSLYEGKKIVLRTVRTYPLDMMDHFKILSLFHHRRLEFLS